MISTLFTVAAPSTVALDVLLRAWPDSSSLAREPYDSPTLHRALELFQEAVQATDLLHAFNGRKGFTHGVALMDPARLKRASMGRWRALMAAHISLDQACQGHLLDILRSGYLEQARLRLVELRAQL